jgi:CheY-like chemotaxis protein
MLEAYDLEVDAAESAEQALEHLKQARPDVIFMDHLMPGMDGFQAIQAIKSNPDTAMIPVMMYTSQEGELYVSQARALGAVGVLPKTVKQGDVSRVLYQLRLLPERRDGRPPPPLTSLGDMVEPGERMPPERPPAVMSGEIETAVRNAVAAALKEHNSELRRFILASFEAFARRITAESKPVAAAGATEGSTQEVAALTPLEPTPSRWPLLAGVAAIALLPTVVLALLYTRTLNSTHDLMQSNAHLASVVEEQQSQLATLQQTVHASAQLPATPVAAASAAGRGAESVPYGETPLAGARLERLREIIDKLKLLGFRGKVKVVSYVGEFCLTGNGIEGYSVASEDLPIKRCDLIGNPFDDALPNTQRQSLAFANLVSSTRQQSGDALRVEIEYSGRRPIVPYPEGEQLTKATASDWNRIAQQNNRVEFTTEPVATTSLAGS